MRFPVLFSFSIPFHHSRFIRDIKEIRPAKRVRNRFPYITPTNLVLLVANDFARPFLVPDEPFPPPFPIIVPIKKSGPFTRSLVFPSRRTVYNANRFGLPTDRRTGIRTPAPRSGPPASRLSETPNRRFRTPTVRSSFRAVRYFRLDFSNSVVANFPFGKRRAGIRTPAPRRPACFSGERRPSRLGRLSRPVRRFNLFSTDTLFPLPVP